MQLQTVRNGKSYIDIYSKSPETASVEGFREKACPAKIPLNPPLNYTKHLFCIINDANFQG